jgi:hypothetical protein
MSQDNPRPKLVVAPVVIAMAAVLIALGRPFQAIGAHLRPGLGEVLNGGICLLLLLVAGVWALVTILRRRPRR